jgi:hypothetical protein
VSIFFIALAAMFNAVMDTITHHYESSIFRLNNRRFWDPSISWKFAKNFPLTTMRMDGWHFAKVGMIWSAIAAVVFYKGPLIPYIPQWLDFFLLGGVWIVSFNVFYNKLLRV